MYRRHKGVNEILALVHMKSLIACSGASISPNVKGANLAVLVDWTGVSPFWFSRTEDVVFKKKCGSVVKKKTLKVASTSASQKLHIF